MPFFVVTPDPQQVHCPRSEGHSCVTTRNHRRLLRWIQAELSKGQVVGVLLDDEILLIGEIKWVKAAGLPLRVQYLGTYAYEDHHLNVDLSKTEPYKNTYAWGEIWKIWKPDENAEIFGIQVEPLYSYPGPAVQS